MTDWTPLTSVVDFTTGRRTLRTLDTMVTRWTCPSGHAATTVGAMVGHAYPAVEEAFRALEKPLGPPACGKCGAAIPRDAPREAFLSTFLPLDGRDVLLRADSRGGRDLALRAPGGAPAPASPSDPALRELGPASATRALALSPGVLQAPPLAEAEARLAEVLAQWPGYPPALKTLGRHRKAAGRVPEAREAFERAVAAAPDDAEAHFLLADLLDEVGEEPLALKHYDESVRLDPHEAPAWSQRGIVLKRLGRLEDALESYRAALGVDPHHAPTLLNLAIVHHARDDEGAVMEAIERVRPSDAAGPLGEAFLQMSGERGLAAVQRGHWLDAARWHELAAGFGPRAPIFHNWGVCLAKVGAWSEAAAKARRAIALDPSYEKARGLLAEAEAALREGVQDRLLNLRARRSIGYADSWGRPTTALHVPVERETTTRLVLAAPGRLSLARDADLLRLLVAKGHNARVGSAPPQKGVLGRLFSRGQEPAPQAEGEEGRPFVLMVESEPEPDVLAFAAAGAWLTKDGKEVPSAPVEVVLAAGGRERVLSPARPGPAFRLGRTLDMDDLARPERFFPE